MLGSVTQSEGRDGAPFRPSADATAGALNVWDAPVGAVEREFFEREGYLVVRSAVSSALVTAAADAVFEFLGMDRGQREGWYRPPLARDGMVELYHHQALWDIRQHPAVYAAFRSLLRTANLWVSIDRVCLKPPAHPRHPEYDHPGFIHWDVDPALRPQPPQVQGVVCLTDTAEDQGGFQCVPETFRGLDEWVAANPAGRAARRPDSAAGLPIRHVAAGAGDLIIWNSTLPHGNGRNRSKLPRLAQYVTMFAACEDEQERRRRVRLWRYRLAPETLAHPGDSRRVEQRLYETAQLTPLGTRLLGPVPWEDGS